jgi:hypothetical protein
VNFAFMLLFQRIARSYSYAHHARAIGISPDIATGKTGALPEEKSADANWLSPASCGQNVSVKPPPPTAV